MIVLWMVGGGAHAQVEDGAVPEINAQMFRPTVDGRRLLWLDDAARGDAGVVARGLLQYVDDPLVYTGTDDRTVDIVSSILQLDLLGAARLGPLRLGIDVPIYLRADGQPDGGETGLGDLGVDGKLSLYDERISLAIGSRLYLPTSTVETALGNPSVGYELTGIVSGDVGPVLLAANLGTRGGPETALENIALDDAFLARVGAALELSRVVDTALEVNAQVPYTAPLSNIDGSPLEALLSAAVRPLRSDWVLRAGAGAGITTGIGAPDYRFLLGLGWEPGDDDEEEPLTVVRDECPDEEEDLDGYQDEDGCPDPTVVGVRVVDAETGDPIEVVRVIVRGGGERVSGTTPFEQPFDPGTYRIRARATGYEPKEIEWVVQGGEPVEAVIELVPLPEQTIIVKRLEMQLEETIQFETNSARILAESLPLLDEAVQVLEDYPEIESMHIVGHTDQRGRAEYNMDLSKRRAAAVRRYFVDKGIDPARLTSEGKGETELLDERDVPEAWDRNRRVEFAIDKWVSKPIEVEADEVTEDMVPVGE